MYHTIGDKLHARQPRCDLCRREEKREVSLAKCPMLMGGALIALTL